MTETIGRVKFTATLDGRGTDRDAERIGRQAGASASEGYDETWSKGFRDTLTKTGRESFDKWQKSGKNDGDIYAKGVESRFNTLRDRARKSFEGIRLDPDFFDDFNKGFDDAGLAAGELQKQLKSLEGVIDGRSLNAAKKQVDDWAKSQREAAIATNDLRDAEETRLTNLDILTEKIRQDEDAHRRLLRVQRDMIDLDMPGEWEEQTDLLDRLARHVDGVGRETSALSLKWQDLSHNTRQWTLIIGAVMAAMEDLAVLGSAAGAGLVAVGGGIAALGAGAYGVGAILVNLFQDIADAPEEMRPTVEEFLGLRKAVGLLNDEIAQAAFDEMDGAFASLTDTLLAISPALSQVGTSLGRLTSSFADAVKPGAEAFEEFDTLIRNSAPLLDQFGRTVGTFGLSLVRAFNEANPLVQDMFDWIDLLVDRFDDFTQNGGLTTWLSNAETVFSSLGPLLDATGRALNDLVTPESVLRTTEFLDNLTAFMPHLADLLNILGELNVFGLAAKALAELGDALAPLQPAFETLADAINDDLKAALDAFGIGIGAVATAIAPLAQAGADFLAAIPPEAFAVAAAGVTALGIAFGALKAGQAITGATQAILGWNAALAAMGPVGAKAAGVVGTLGKAGIWGAVAAGAYIGIDALANWVRELSDVEEQAASLVGSNASIEQSFNTLSGVADGLIPKITDWQGVLTDLGKVGNPFENFALAFSETGSQALALSGALGELDGPLSDLASRSLPQAAQQFAAWAEEAGASGSQIGALIEQMPGFQTALEAAGINVSDLTSAQQLLDEVMGESTLEQLRAEAAATENANALAELRGAAVDTGDEVDDLADKIRNFGSATLTTRDANRQFEAALDDLTDSLAENGTTLDTTTEAGRKNEQALDDVAKSALELAAATVEQTGKQEDANAVISKGRDELIKMLGQFGITGDAAEDYADELGLIPGNVDTAVRLSGVSAAEQALNALTRQRSVTIFATVGGWNPSTGNRPMASGGTLYGPTNVLAGEAGPEAIVPLDRPLHLVDESVRWLSAIAQGKSMPAMAAGGTVGGGAPIWQGDMNVYDKSGDPRRTANETIMRLYERAASR